MNYPQYSSVTLPSVKSLLAEVSHPHYPSHSSASAWNPSKRTRDMYEQPQYPSYHVPQHYHEHEHSHEMPLKKRRNNESLAVSIPPAIRVSSPHYSPKSYSPYSDDEIVNSRSPLRIFSEAERSPSSSPTPRSPSYRSTVLTPESVKQAITEKLYPSPNSTRGKSAKSKSHHFLPQDSIAILKRWFFANVEHPYPSSAEKERLSKETGLSYLQVSNWFTNSRKRVWAPSVRAAGLSAVNLDNL